MEKARSFLIYIATTLSLVIITSCGPNVFKSVDKAVPEDLAVRYLEEGNPGKAISILLDELGGDLKDIIESDLNEAELTATIVATEGGGEKRNIYLSVLASAYAQLYKLDPIDLALKLAASQSSGSDTGLADTSATSSVTALFPVLPPATTENIEGIAKALAILQAVDSSAMTTADIFKQGLFMTSLFSLQIKKLDIDGDGQISALEAINLSADDAGFIISTLASAIGSIAAYAGGSEDNQVAQQMASQLGTYQSSISGKEGTDDTEKLRNFVISIQG